MKIQTETTIAVSHFVHTADKDSPCRRLHGHNVRIIIEIDGIVSDDGMIVDFRKIKNYFQQFDHKTLIPKHLAEQCSYHKRNYQIFHNVKCYSIPKEDVELLPIDSITSENLTNYFYQEILKIIDIQPNSIKITLYESDKSFSSIEV